VTDHERIEELLAGYVLRSLSGEDAADADLLLSEHVPTCARCQETLAAFQAISADLALDAAPVAPPETLLPRLHRELEPPSRRRRPMQLFAVAASVVVVAGLAGMAVTQNVRANQGQQRASALRAAMDTAALPNANLVPVGPATEISAPGREVFYLYGHDVPAPTAGMVYRVWLVAGTAPTYVGEFIPDDGFVNVELHFDPSSYDSLWVTEAPAGSEPTAPSAEEAVWQAAS
jgi:Anti-sigma-K factor rskA, C-terminal